MKFFELEQITSVSCPECGKEVSFIPNKMFDRSVNSETVQFTCDHCSLDFKITKEVHWIFRPGELNGDDNHRKHDPSQESMRDVLLYLKRIKEILAFEPVSIRANTALRQTLNCEYQILRQVESDDKENSDDIN